VGLLNGSTQAVKSALGQKLAFRKISGMSVLPLKANLAS